MKYSGFFCVYCLSALCFVSFCVEKEDVLEQKVRIAFINAIPEAPIDAISRHLRTEVVIDKPMGKKIRVDIIAKGRPAGVVLDEIMTIYTGKQRWNDESFPPHEYKYSIKHKDGKIYIKHWVEEPKER